MTLDRAWVQAQACGDVLVAQLLDPGQQKHFAGRRGQAVDQAFKMVKGVSGHGTALG
ncbi:hypothetical protein D3C79_1083850 [compost metagenome]